MALYRGFSVRATLPQALSLARSLRKTHIAEIVLDWEEADAVARTLQTRGHHTVWADAESVRLRIRDVHEV
jgi:hypothetical protein